MNVNIDELLQMDRMMDYLKMDYDTYIVYKEISAYDFTEGDPCIAVAVNAILAARDKAEKEKNDGGIDIYEMLQPVYYDADFSEAASSYAITADSYYKVFKREATFSDVIEDKFLEMFNNDCKKTYNSKGYGFEDVDIEPSFEEWVSNGHAEEAIAQREEAAALVRSPYEDVFDLVTRAGDYVYDKMVEEKLTGEKGEELSVTDDYAIKKVLRTDVFDCSYLTLKLIMNGFETSEDKSQISTPTASDSPAVLEPAPSKSEITCKKFAEFWDDEEIGGYPYGYYDGV